MAHAPRGEPRPAPHERPTWPEIVRRLLLHARHLGATREEAEDLAHDALELVVREPGWFDPTRGELLGALKVVLRNRFLNVLRSRVVHHRAAPRLQIVPDPPGPDVALGSATARELRRRLLALLEPEERAVFAAWMRQRAGEPGPEAARSLGLTHAGYEAAKKRLRRRVHALLDELGVAPGDLFDPARSGGAP